MVYSILIGMVLVVRKLIYCASCLHHVSHWQVLLSIFKQLYELSVMSPRPQDRTAQHSHQRKQTKNNIKNYSVFKKKWYWCISSYYIFPRRDKQEWEEDGQCANSKTEDEITRPTGTSLTRYVLHNHKDQSCPNTTR